MNRYLVISTDRQSLRKFVFLPSGQCNLECVVWLPYDTHLFHFHEFRFGDEKLSRAESASSSKDRWAGSRDVMMIPCFTSFDEKLGCRIWGNSLRIIWKGLLVEAIIVANLGVSFVVCVIHGAEVYDSASIRRRQRRSTSRLCARRKSAPNRGCVTSAITRRAW